MLRRPPVSALQLLIILQLNKKPKYGYEVLKELREPFRGIWKPKTGTIYPALKRLEAKGFLKTEMIDEKAFYSLTEKGRALLEQMGERLDRNFVFADRYFRFVTEQMSIEMKEKMVKNLGIMTNEAGRLLFFIEYFLEDLDRGTKLSFFEKMKERMTITLNLLDEKIRNLKESEYS